MVIKICGFIGRCLPAVRLRWALAGGDVGYWMFSYMKILAQNKEVFYSYKILEKFEAGIVLTGPEVKSAKLGQISLRGSYISVRQGKKPQLPELFLINCHIASYEPAAQTQKNYQPTRERKLLLKRTEIKSLIGKLSQRGLTIVPLKLYTKKRLVKVELALAQGKTKIDKREQIKKRETERQIRRALKTKMYR